MNLEDFDYDLPPSLIAQTPAAERSASRLMVVERATGRIAHHCFSELPQLLPPEQLLVLNNSRVFPARLMARKISGAQIEVLLLREGDGHTWEALIRPGRKARAGDRLIFEPRVLEAVVMGGAKGLIRRLQFEPAANPREWAWQHGAMPLPPYIKRSSGDSPEDRERYQTIYSTVEGSVAAPTAGLHFTRELLQLLPHEFITLHVGYGTFQPVRVDDIREHRMETEHFEVSAAAAAAINHHRAEGGTLTAVGTTTTRVLESLFARHSEMRAGKGETDLFIYPGYRFRAIDALVTNFHLPRSTLLMLVAAFAGVELIHRCYRIAVEEKYRFFSYGDAMLIL